MKVTMPNHGIKRLKRRNASPQRLWMAVGAALGAAATGVIAYFDKRRRHGARDKAVSIVRKGGEEAARKGEYAKGVAQGAVHKMTPGHKAREYDDMTLARKVESEILRPQDAPKGSVSVNVANGVVELRGMVDRPEQIEALGDAAERVDGVKEVHNLLHTPGSEPGHSPGGRFTTSDRATS